MHASARNLTIAFFVLLAFGALSPMTLGSAKFPQWLEVVLGGLMSGVLYSLVALGLVLIFKASGVFNFAQGAMVLFAALTLVRLMEKMPFAAALVATIAVMVALAWLVERLVLRPLVNQEGIVLFMATLGVRLLPRRLRPDDLGQRHLHAARGHAQGAEDHPREHLRRAASS
jgi:branched-chain amino acid transport system permease protein